MSQNPSHPVADPERVKRSNRRTAIALLLVFTLPVIVAYLLLQTGLYQRFGTANKGDLLTPPVQMFEAVWRTPDGKTVSQKTLRANWWLAYQMPRECTQSCEQRLFQIRQSLRTLGPDQGRVGALIMAQPKADLAALKTWLTSVDQSKQRVIVTYENPGEQAIAKVHVDLDQGGLYVIDPLGFAMLHYSTEQEPQAAKMQAKKMLKDLKYLLKVSRIG